MGLIFRQQKGAMLPWFILILGLIASSTLHLWHVTQTQFRIHGNYNAYASRQVAMEDKINQLEQSIYKDQEKVRQILHQHVGFIPDTLTFGEPSGVDVLEFQIYLDDAEQDIAITIREKLRMR